ncbi:MAG TPA: hypothetical protein VHK04_07135 [Castellaniella sp.]|nr:hypothetical protein [Castellaniella sp.]
MDQEDQPQTGSSQPPPPTSEPTAPPAPQPTSAPPPPASPTPGPTTTGQRPTGITVLAILAAISGVFGIFGSLVVLMGGAALGVAVGSADLGALTSVVGAVWLISSIAFLLFAWGAWGLQPWAWTLGVILAAVQIVLGVFQLFNGSPGSIVSILIAAGITYYLFQPEVKTAFGRT